VSEVIQDSNAVPAAIMFASPGSVVPTFSNTILGSASPINMLVVLNGQTLLAPK
jgi:hypothetical protein